MSKSAQDTKRSVQEILNNSFDEDNNALAMQTEVGGSPVSASNPLPVSATVNVGDIELGQVELKDADSTAEANIKAANTARTTATNVLATQHIDASGNVGGTTAANTARTTATLVNPVQPIDASGNVLGRTTANTARTTATLVDPVEIVDASGNVVNVSAAQTARTTATLVLPVQPVDGSGNVLGRTAANTARTTATLVDPVQIVDAAGNVQSISAANTARTTATMVQPVQHVDAAGTVGGTTLNSLISGEDQTNDVLKTEGQFSYAYCTADTQVKGAAGFVHSITISPTDATATAGSIILFDSLTETGTACFTYYIPAAALVPVTVILDIKMLTGIYVGYTTVADVATTVSFR